MQFCTRESYGIGTSLSFKHNRPVPCESNFLVRGCHALVTLKLEKYVGAL